jgi:hypothetical protein
MISPTTQGLRGNAEAAGDDLGVGTALVAADFNADGYADLAIGAPDETSKRGGLETGAAHILFGAGAA